jgi:hypothetical protein
MLIILMMKVRADYIYIYIKSPFFLNFFFWLLDLLLKIVYSFDFQKYLIYLIFNQKPNLFIKAFLLSQNEFTDTHKKNTSL